MWLLWVVGPVAVLVGTLTTVIWHRRLEAAAQDLNATVEGLDDLRRTLREVRAVGGQVAGKTGRLREG